MTGRSPKDVLSRDGSIALHRCAAAFEADADHHAMAVTAAIHRAIDEFVDVNPFTAHTVAATRSSFHAFCALLRVEDEFEFHAPPAATAIARAYVRRGISLRVLIRCYQVGHGEMWRVWRGIVREHDLPVELELEVLTRSSEILIALIERFTDDVVESYEQEERQWRRSMSAIREERVRQLLAGTAVDVAKAEQALVYDLQGEQLGIVLWSADGRDRIDDLEATWRAMVKAAGSHAATAVVPGSSVLWGWLADRAGNLEASMETLKHRKLPDGIRAACGKPGSGVSGFRMSHFQAMHARRVMELGGLDHAPVTRFADVAVAALTTADPKLASSFAEDALGGLDGDGDALARLRETLEAYFSERESPSAAARRLGIHVNTVLYRLKQIEDILGAPAHERRLELELALLLRHLLGTSAATGGGATRAAAL